MHILLRVIFVLVLFVLDSCQKPPNSSVAFKLVQENSLDEMLNEAKKKNQLVFVDMYATWCGPCKYMDEKVFNKQEVATKLNKEFVNFKVDVDTFEGAKLRNKYRVDAYPTYFFINSKGEVIHRLEGVFTPKLIMDEADFAKKEAK